MKTPFFAVAFAISLLGHNAQAQSMDWSWTTAPWTEDDKPFAAIRKQLFQQAKKKKLTVAQVQNLQRASASDPWNPPKQFRFAYSAYLLDKQLPERQALVGAATQALTQSQFISLQAPPRPVLAYNFCRLRFLLTARDMPYPELLPAGERILKREPNDYPVQYYVAILLEGDNPAHRPRKLRLIKAMMKSHPNDPAPRVAYADAYQTLWRTTHKRSDARAALATFKNIKVMKPLLSQVNPIADEAIARITRIQAFWEKRHPELAKQ